MNVLVTDEGNCYHRIDRDIRENVACRTFISKDTREVEKEKAEEEGFEACGYTRCFGDDNNE